jgi:hypothetical protein
LKCQIKEAGARDRNSTTLDRGLTGRDPQVQGRKSGLKACNVIMLDNHYI